MENSSPPFTQTSTAKWGVIVGRFQTPSLHEGHRHLINSVLERHEKVLILIGISGANPTPRNPLDFETRRRMIESAFGSGISIESIRDCKEDAVWYQNLDQQVAQTLEGESFCLYGSRDSFIDAYPGQYPCCRIESPTDCAATDLRNSAARQPLDSSDFRSGVVYAVSNRFAQVYPTVDIAIFRKKRRQILLGRKPLETLFRFPGGFVDPTDENFEAAALREAKEECGDLLLENLHYMGSRRIDDWRYRRSPDAICTLFFSVDCVGGEAIPQDDLAELQWFDVDRILPEQLVQEHRNLWQFLIFNS